MLEVLLVFLKQLLYRDQWPMAIIHVLRYGPQRVKPNYFGDHLKIALVPPVGQSCHVSNEMFQHLLCGTKCGKDICGFQWM